MHKISAIDFHGLAGDVPGFGLCAMPIASRDFAESLFFAPFIGKTKPDKRLPKSRAGGQGPYLRSPDHLGRRSEVEEIKS